MAEPSISLGDHQAFAARYLIVLTPRLASLLQTLQRTPDVSQHAAIYRAFESELVEQPDVR